MYDEIIKWCVAFTVGAIIRAVEKRRLKKKGLLKESSKDETK